MLTFFSISQDDDGGCGVQDERGQFTGEQDSTSNGCNQNWGTQICSCGAEGYKPWNSVCSGIDLGGDTGTNSFAVNLTRLTSGGTCMPQPALRSAETGTNRCALIAA